MYHLNDITALVMARHPVPGKVKTRLIGGAITAELAAEIADAMLRCIVARVTSTFGRTVVAVTPDGCGGALRGCLGEGDHSLIDQGEGDLGTRMDRVWRHLGPDRPVAFFGMDSPDVPLDHLLQIPTALDVSEAALGPTSDGGYWTIAARSHQPALLQNIDWGGESVYDQTCRRAEKANVSLTHLPIWEDVDDEDDLKALCRRLSGLDRLPAPEIEPLKELARRLAELTAR